MNKEEILDTLYQLSVTAGTNQRYYRDLLTTSEAEDSHIRFIVGAVAIVSLALAIVAVFRGEASPLPWKFEILKKFTSWNVASVCVAILSAIVAWQLNESPEVSALVRTADIYRRWSDLRTDIDTLQEQVEQEPDDKLPSDIGERMRVLLARKNQNNAYDRAPDEKLLEKCEEDENLSRTGFRTIEEWKAAQAAPKESPPATVLGSPRKP